MAERLYMSVCAWVWRVGSSLHFLHFVQFWHTDPIKIDLLSNHNQNLFVNSFHYECLENAIEKGATMSNPVKEEFEWDHVKFYA